MDKARTFVKITVLVLMNLVTVTLSIELFDYATGVLKLGKCVSSYAALACDIERTQDIQWLPYLVLLAAAVAALAVTLMFLYRLSVAPFFLFMIATLVFCVSFDLIFQLPVRNFSRLFSSTYNLTTVVVVFFSFLFVMAIARFEMRLGWRFFGAMMQSYLMRDIAFVFYAAVQGLYAGMTSLYLMFVAFAFGAFTIHIMSIAGVLRRSSELRDADARF
jgi:hypothetical protein